MTSGHDQRVQHSSTDTGRNSINTTRAPQHVLPCIGLCVFSSLHTNGLCNKLINVKIRNRKKKQSVVHKYDWWMDVRLKHLHPFGSCCSLSPKRRVVLRFDPVVLSPSLLLSGGALLPTSFACWGWCNMRCSTGMSH